MVKVVKKFGTGEMILNFFSVYIYYFFMQLLLIGKLKLRAQFLTEAFLESAKK